MKKKRLFKVFSLLFYLFLWIIILFIFKKEYAAKDSTVNFSDGKELNDVFVVKSKTKKQGQK